jgi:hypothetical protein
MLLYVLRLTATTVLCASLALPLSSQIPAVQSVRPPLEVKVDGRIDDWPASSFILDAKSGTEFAFLNDARAFYILLVARKPEARTSLESTGITVLARSRDAKTSRGVLFVKRRVPAETCIRWQESQGALLTEEEKTKLRAVADCDLCLAFAVTEKGSIFGPLRRLPEGDPPECGVSEEASATVYELKIPLTRPDLVPGGLGASPGESVRLSFEWGGASRKVLSPKSTREASALEQQGALAGSGITWAQEFLDAFDSLSRPTMGTKPLSFTVEVRLAEAE